VFATGASVIRPPLKGDAAGARVLRERSDGLRRFPHGHAAPRGRRAIIGAGLIGCEFANDLLNGGFEVDVIDPLDWCLPTLLPEPCGRAVQAGLEAAARAFISGRWSPRSTTADGSRDRRAGAAQRRAAIEADIVVSAVGVRPRTDLAQAAGLETKRGIVADRYLRTSADGVYALGDCAEVEGHVLVYVAPLMAAARALGKTLAGEPTAVSYPAMPVTIKTPACPTVVAPPPAARRGCVGSTVDGRNLRAEFRDATGELLGLRLPARRRDKIALQKQLPPILA
jgi:rubredoxin-NAD+ reductase